MIYDLSWLNGVFFLLLSPVAVWRWHNTGNWKTKLSNYKKETWGEKVFPTAARGADYYHFWARSLQCKPNPNHTPLSDSTDSFLPLFFFTNSRESVGARGHRCSHPSPLRTWLISYRVRSCLHAQTDTKSISFRKAKLYITYTSNSTCIVERTRAKCNTQ